VTGVSDLDIVTAGRLLRRGGVTSLDLTRACLARIHERNPQLNAFIAVTADEALEAATEADDALRRGIDRGPLHGIPVSLKDLVDQRGVPTTAASRVIDPVPAVRDAPITRALREAGAILVGKTNLHEFALGTTSDESAFGPVRHPAVLDRSPGGSSGGSAVAVATGMSFASIGTDTGGSIRIPASACGIVGLKPGIGEVSTEGVIPLSRTLDHAGPLTRTVADAALVYEALTGTRVPLTSPGGLAGHRLGTLDGYFTARLEPEVRHAFEHACRTLERAGATLVRVEVPHAATIPAVYLGILFPEAAAYHASMLERRPDRYSPGVRARFEAARYVLGEDYLRALKGQQVLREEVDRALHSCDALVLPTMPVVAPPIGATTVEIDGTAEPVRNLMLRLTQPFSTTGHPAITLPDGRGAHGLPCGLQLVGRRGGTPALLELALACEPHIGRGTG
jgi:aspartyl-tRNA(Asn)/glutamyl-tRNA(Gln) amidotransferase subunit A